MLPIDDLAALEAAEVDYLVFHKDLFNETRMGPRERPHDNLLSDAERERWKARPGRFDDLDVSGCIAAFRERGAPVHEDADLVVFSLSANAFLHHMVRNIVGTLLRVGRGEGDAGWVAQVLRGRDRHAGGATAPAAGLYLAHVTYPRAFSLPSSAEAAHRVRADL